MQYTEQRAVSELGVRRLFLLTTRAADWFQARGFKPAGRAAGNPELPAGRVVDVGRNSLLFVKDLGGGGGAAEAADAARLSAFNA